MLSFPSTIINATIMQAIIIRTRTTACLFYRYVKRSVNLIVGRLGLFKKWFAAKVLSQLSAFNVVIFCCTFVFSSVSLRTSFDVFCLPLVSGRSRSWKVWICTSSVNIPKSYFVRLSPTRRPTVEWCVESMSPCCPQPSGCRCGYHQSRVPLSPTVKPTRP